MPGKTRPLDTLVRLLAERHALDPAQARHFAWQYGSEADQVLALCKDTPRGMEPIVADLPIVWGEVDWIVREEMALTLVDLAVRRTQLYYLSGDKLLPHLDELARKMADLCAYPSSRVQELADEMRTYVIAHRVGPQEARHVA